MTASAILLGLAGLLAGTAIHRLLPYLTREGPFSLVGSCGSCGRFHSGWSVVPVVGYLAAGGGCPACGSRRTLGELTLGLVGAAAFAGGVLVPAPRLALYIMLAAVLITVSATDLRARIIPNKVVVPGILVSFLLVPLAGEPWLEPLIGVLTGGGILFVLALIRPGGMGMGDVKLAAFLGGFLGLDVLLTLLIASLALGVVAITLLALRLRSGKDLLPYGPFLSAAGSLVFLLGG